MDRINKWITGHSVELPEMLSGREKRAERQKRLLERYGVPVICFTLNIAGPVKVFPLSVRAFYAGVLAAGEKLATEIGEEKCLFMQVLDNAWGYEAFYAVDEDAAVIKKAMAAIEEEHPFGRLFDIDVIKPDGEKVSRQDIGYGQRRCLICGEDAAFCASTRAHTVAELQDKTAEMIISGLTEAEVVSARAETALLREVFTTPKPGLVDLRNTGAHSDMDAALFAESARVTADYYGQCYMVGMNHHNEFTSNLLQYLRPLGISAEEEMYEATGGVNTHKGMIFSLGILAAAYGYTGKNDAALALATAGEIGTPAMKDFMDLSENYSSGKSQYAKYGLGGIRGEVASGFRSVKDIGLPAFKIALEEGRSYNDAGVCALLAMISKVDDSNMISRGGLQLAQELRQKAAAVYASGAATEDVEALDDEFIRNNMSPGGCADLLAIIYYLDLCE